MADETTTLQDMSAAISAYELGLINALKAAGIEDATLSEVSVLAVVSEVPKSITQIAGVRGVSKQAVQSQIQSLAKRGLADLKPDPSDARIKLVSLTPKGRGVVAAFKAAGSDVEAQLEAKLGIERLKNFRNMLGQVVGAVS